MITPRTREDINYFDCEIHRDSRDVSSTFVPLDRQGPLNAAVAHAQAYGSVAILDAGCGTGYTLADMKEQVQIKALVPKGAVHAVGVSLGDLRDRYGSRFRETPARERARLYNGYISYKLGNLATMDLEPDQFDIAYAHEVLPHNTTIIPLLAAVLRTIRPGGTFWCNMMPSQQPERDKYVRTLGIGMWTVKSTDVTRPKKDGTDTRTVTKFVRSTL